MYIYVWGWVKAYEITIVAGTTIQVAVRPRSLHHPGHGAEDQPRRNGDVDLGGFGSHGGNPQSPWLFQYSNCRLMMG